MAGWRLSVTSWRPEVLEEKAERALRNYAEALSPQFDAQITAEKWVWPTTTRRKKDGATVTSPRDIVDQGTLLRSKRVYQPEPGSVAFVWDPVNPADGERYGRIVQTGVGYVNRKGAPIQRPGRDWVRPVLEANPIVAGFTSAWRALPAVRR